MDQAPILIAAVAMGIAVTTTGMFLLVGALRHPKRPRGGHAARQLALSVVLQCVGVCVSMAAWFSWPKTPGYDFDPSQNLWQPRTVTGFATNADGSEDTLVGRHWILLLWDAVQGDNSIASEPPPEANQRLADLVSQSLLQQSLAPRGVRALFLSNEVAEQLATGPLPLEVLCSPAPHGLVLLLELRSDTPRAQGFSRSWPQTRYRLLDCERSIVSGHTASLAANPESDRLAYEQALRDDLAQALRALGAGALADRR